MHSKPTRKDMNAIDDPQHPPKPLPDAHPLKRCGKAEAIRGDDWTCCLTAGHRGACLPSKPMRPRGAGSEVRWIHGCHTDKSDQFIPMPKYGITDENAPRVLRAIYEDEPTLAIHSMSAHKILHGVEHDVDSVELGEPPRDMVGELARRVRNLSAVHKLALIAVIVAGSCAFVVGVAYGWGVFW